MAFWFLIWSRLDYVVTLALGVMAMTEESWRTELKP
jgi:hypothetical protein